MSGNDILLLTEESPSILSHLSMLQNIIQRMATNSSSCKSWCITLVSAILVIFADKDKPDYALIALFPTMIFAFLDAYYLSLEKGFVSYYNDFVKRLHAQELKQSDLYVINPSEKIFYSQLSALKSISVWGFYIPLSVLIYVSKVIYIG